MNTERLWLGRSREGNLRKQGIYTTASRSFACNVDMLSAFWHVSLIWSRVLALYVFFFVSLSTSSSSLSIVYDARVYRILCIHLCIHAREFSWPYLESLCPCTHTQLARTHTNARTHARTQAREGACRHGHECSHVSPCSSSRQAFSQMICSM